MISNGYFISDEEPLTCPDHTRCAADARGRFLKWQAISTFSEPEWVHSPTLLKALRETLGGEG
jgi:hypothetical protein